MLVKVRQLLIQRNYLSESAPKLGRMLDLLCLSTIADCMTLGSVMNRALVKYGLEAINSENRICWTAFKKHHNKSILDPNDISFLLAPAINSASRLTHAMMSYHFLTATNIEDAEHYLKEIIQSNDNRKVIEKQMKKIAMVAAQKQIDNGDSTIVIYDESFTSGVQGIVASRLVERFGKPSVVFSKKLNSVISGSARGVAGMNIKHIIETIDKENVGLLNGFVGINLRVLLPAQNQPHPRTLKKHLKKKLKKLKKKNN